MSPAGEMLKTTEAAVVSRVALRDVNRVIDDGDWTFVTRNSVEFRGPSSRPGSRGQYANVEIHVGLVCLNGPDGTDLDAHIQMFEQALDNSQQIGSGGSLSFIACTRLAPRRSGQRRCRRMRHAATYGDYPAQREGNRL